MTASTSLGGQKIHRVRQQRSLGVLIDDRVNWRPTALKILSSCRCLLAVPRWFCGPSWGNSHKSMLRLYSGLLVQRILYACATIRCRRESQWECLELLHRVALGSAWANNPFRAARPRLLKRKKCPFASMNYNGLIDIWSAYRLKHCDSGSSHGQIFASVASCSSSLNVWALQEI